MTAINKKEETLARMDDKKDFLATLGIMQENYFLENKRFAGNPNRLVTGRPFKKKENLWVVPASDDSPFAEDQDFALKTSDDQKSYIAYTEMEKYQAEETGVGTMAIKGVPGEFQTFCDLGKYCDEDFLGSAEEANSREGIGDTVSFFPSINQMSNESGKETTIAKELGFSEQHPKKESCSLSADSPLIVASTGETNLYQPNFSC